MNIKKLYYHYMKDNPSSSVERFRKIIFTWMGNIILNRITKEDMLILLYKLDYMEYEYGNAIAKENVKQLAEPYQKKGINLRKAFHITSSTLYKVFNCEIIAISSALEFCKLNNLKLSDYFKIYSKKKTYTKEMKKDIILIPNLLILVDSNCSPIFSINLEPIVKCTSLLIIGCIKSFI